MPHLRVVATQVGRRTNSARKMLLLGGKWTVRLKRRWRQSGYADVES